MLVFISLGISSLLLLLVPQVQWYLGFSGVLYGLFMGGGIKAVAQKQQRFGYALIGLIILKLTWDTYNNHASLTTQLIGAPVLSIAHWFGILLGALAALPSFYKK
jgi:cytochrome b